MNNFIDNIEFNKEVILKEPKIKKRKSKKLSRIYRRLMQLVFFIVVLIILWYSGKYAIVSVASFCKSKQYNSSLKRDWNNK